MTSDTATPTVLPAATRRRLQDLFSREEIAQLTARSDLRGAWAVVSTWGLIALALAMLARWPHPLTFVLALIVIGGRQLALAILHHEGAHGTLFRSRWLNDRLTDGLCARPIWLHLPKYRAHHLVHHTRTGTDADPDLSLHVGYPTSRRSLARKFLRDVSGVTGVKLVLGLILMDAGVLKWTVASAVEKLPQDGRRWWDYPVSFARNAWPMLFANGLLFGLLAMLGQGWLYGVWLLAYLTTYPLFVRIRSIAEHGCLERVPDMFRNTRTTRAGWLARLTVAPFRVNYHLEHHVMASVPYYRLPRMHRLLRERGAVAAPVGYVGVLRLAAAG